uniref:Elongator complex protein 4 n=1 Tax=Lactuca sativa TaxID=4236 RepID=A0A9R1VEE9_LACSA|nr:hypothetical protein LSAT_V11C500239030 [Lactuca sativa]
MIKGLGSHLRIKKTVRYLWLLAKSGQVVSQRTFQLHLPLLSLVSSMDQMEQSFFHQAYQILIGLVHNQPVLYASPVKNPSAFLRTLPITLVPKDDKSRNTDAEQKDLRIAWQYKKYLGENKQHNEERDGKIEYCNEFDLRKPIENHLITGNRVECFSLLDCSNLAGFRDSCSKFISQFPKY